MKKSLLLLLSILFAITNAVYAQHIATLEVKSPNYNGLEVPVQVNLDAITFLPDSVLQLVEIKGTAKVPVSYQIEFAGQRILHWILQPQSDKNARVFELLKNRPTTTKVHIKAQAADGFLTISNGNSKLLRYNYKTMYPPAGVDTVYRRSGFIHPLWSPRGQELTRIHAPDHYHHWGLWNPWTEVLFEGDSVDFWNLSRKQGTVRFARFISTTDGPVYAGFNALHEHVVFKKDGGEKVALNEVQSVRIYQPATQSNYYIADITSRLNCATDSPVLLLEYRYGGLGIRATQEWNKDNSKIITSEGKNRKEADGSKARWCMVQGNVNGDYAGLVMMSYPTNYNYPEPLRVWPENMNGRGDVFLNFSPTKDRNWLLEPGKTYVLQYRLLVFNDAFPAQKAEAAWQHFATPPAIMVKINK